MSDDGGRGGCIRRQLHRLFSAEVLTAFGCTFLTLFPVGIAAFILFRRTLDGTIIWPSIGGSALDGTRLTQNATYLVLLVTSFCFVGLNTFIYVIEMTVTAVNREVGIGGSAFWFGVAMAILVAVTLVTGVGIGLICFRDMGHTPEYFAMCVFGAFVVVDVILAVLQRHGVGRLREEISKTADLKRRIKLEMAILRAPILSDWSILQALAVDLPVALGLWGVLALVESDWITEHAHRAFLAGSIAMHVIASQVIFLLLRFFFAWRVSGLRPPLGLAPQEKAARPVSPALAVAAMHPTSQSTTSQAPKRPKPKAGRR